MTTRTPSPDQAQQVTSATLFWHRTGPLLKYCGGVLQISDLNPERKLFWRVRRLEMLHIGLRCILAAVLVP